MQIKENIIKDITYITEDGALFREEKECIAYEKMLHKVQKFAKENNIKIEENKEKFNNNKRHVIYTMYLSTKENIKKAKELIPEYFRCCSLGPYDWENWEKDIIYFYIQVDHFEKGFTDDDEEDEEEDFTNEDFEEDFTNDDDEVETWIAQYGRSVKEEITDTKNTIKRNKQNIEELESQLNF